MNWLRKGFVVLVLALVSVAPAWSQATSALTGTVTDPTGAVVPGAELSLTNPATGVARTTTTAPDGGYLFPRLDPGTYRLEVTAQGFKKAVHDRVVVAVGTTTSLNVQLEVGAVAETVEVEAATAAINTSDASVGNPLLGIEVRRLPSLDLNPAGLLSLQPGVTFVATGSTSGYGGGDDFDGRSGSVNGSRSDQTNITLDGVDVNDPQYGFAFTTALRATQASLQEFRVTTANYNADQGRSSGGQVQLVTKSGTNELHGSAYYLHRNEAFNANNFFLNMDGTKEPKLRRHIYGAALGGPVVKNRFFVFGNFERLQESVFGTARRDIPSMGYRDGVLIYECQDVPGFPPCPTTTSTVTGLSGATYGVGPFGSCQIGTPNCGPIPAGHVGLGPAALTSLDPLGIGPSVPVSANLNNFPAPNAAGAFDPFNIVSFRFGAPIENEYNTYIIRFDANLDAAAKHTLYWRGSLQDDVENSTPLFPGQPAQSKGLIASKGFALGYKAVINPTTVNEFRWGITRLKEGTAGNQGTEYVDLRFLDNDQDYASDSFGRTIPQQHVRDDITLIRGTHTVSFGADLRFTRSESFNNGNSFHFYQSNPSWLPDGGRELQPGAATCMNGGLTPGTPCTSFPAVSIPFGSSFRDSIPQIMGVITAASAQYNFDRTGATLPDGANVRRRFAVDEYEFYVQDQWRVAPSLSFTYGLRYFVSSPPWETNGNQVVPYPNIGDWFELRRTLMLSGLPTSEAGLLSFRLGGPANNGPHYYPWDHNNFSPRVALAYSPRFQEGFLGKLFGDGKMVIRGGYSLVYDRVGSGLATTFDAGGSFGMATSLSNSLGSCDPSTCPRFAGVFSTSFRDGPDGIRGTADDFLPQSPGGGFPATPPTAIDVSTTLDSKIEHPYAHMFTVSIGRELGGNMSFEALYVGRRGRKLLLLEDKSMPADLCDPASGICTFQAQKMLVAFAAANQGVFGQGLTSLGPIAYWENLFPGFGPAGVNGGCLVRDVFRVTRGPDGVAGTADDLPRCGWSATQVAYDGIMRWHGDTRRGSGFGVSTWPQEIDFGGFSTAPAPFGGFRPGFPSYMSLPSCTGPFQVDSDGETVVDRVFDSAPGCPFAFFPSQYVQLRAQSSVARSEYHALQLILRKRMSQGVLFNINYTLSHSTDHASTPERAGDFGGFFAGGYTGFSLNSWDLESNYGYSDFDMRHQLNSHWVIELPFGRGKRFGADMPGALNQVLGGWEVSGILRINSGLPAGIFNGRTWPTNWNYSGNATCAPVGAHPFGLAYGPCPATQNVKNAVDSSGSGRGPNIFANPDEALTHVRFTEPGATGLRNPIRADKYFTMDFGLGKSFPIRENHRLGIRWEVFNLTNSTYFDAVSLEMDPESAASFGNYFSVMGGPRRMQLSLRYEF